MLQQSLHINKFFGFLLIYICLSTNVSAECPLQEGDIVFIKSQSKQSELIKIVTGSEWTHVGLAFREASGFKILEAVQPVKWTNLLSFLERSKNLAFEIKRAKFPFDSVLLKAESLKDLNKDYDLIFNWDDNAIYCSELVWKSYFRTSHVEIGRLQKNKDFPNADNYKVQHELQSRYKQLGRTYNKETWLEEPVISPIQLMRSLKIETVYTSLDMPLLKKCFNKK